MSYAESTEPQALIRAIPSEPVAIKPKTPKTRRYGFTPWECRRIDKQQVRLLKDALGLK